MSERDVWFEYSRPFRGKLSAVPVHPFGWAALLAVPVPGLVAGRLLAGPLGRFGAGLACVAVLLVSLWVLFRLVVRRGRRVD